jgi:hypothetical protein
MAADILGWAFLVINGLTFCYLLRAMNRCRQLEELANAKNIVAQNKALAIDLMLREIQLLQADLDIAHQAVEWEVLQVEQVRGRRVH